MTVVEVKTLSRLGIGLGAPVHPHHAWIEKGTNCRSGSRPKKTSCGDRRPVFALVAEWLKRSETHRTASSHRRLPLASTNGILPRSTPGNSLPISRCTAWPPFIARQIALSTTAFAAASLGPCTRGESRQSRSSPHSHG